MIRVCKLQNFQQFCGNESITTGYGGESAGLDLYNAGPDLVIPPANHQLHIADVYGSFNEIPSELSKQIFGKLIPTGIKVVIPDGMVGLIFERGSVTKTPLKVRAGVIDSGYCGEIFINSLNLSSHPITIASGAKTAFQLIAVPIDNWFSSVSEEEYAEVTLTAKRQAGKIGSTDTLVGKLFAKEVLIAGTIQNVNL